MHYGTTTSEPTKTYLIVELDHGSGEGIYFGGVAPHRVSPQLSVQDRGEVGSIDSLKLLLVWVSAMEKNDCSSYAITFLLFLPALYPYKINRGSFVYNHNRIHR